MEIEKEVRYLIDNKVLKKIIKETKPFKERTKMLDITCGYDGFDILGNYVEIEYQNSRDSEKEVNDFIKLVGINGEEQDMYGGIVKDKLEKDKEFKKIFEDNLKKIINS